MEHLNKRNIEREGIADLEHVLLRGSGEQIRLTEEYILPNIELIVAEAETFRQVVDKKLKGSKEDTSHQYSDVYPIGRCQEINAAVNEDIMNNLNNPALSSMRVLRKFVKAGGTIRKAWCIKDSSSFHNAILIGNAVLDVANDTVDKDQPSVTFTPDIRESGYKTIATIEQYADIAEQYWGYKVYPNIYLPALAPLYPVIFRKKLYHHADTSKPSEMDGLFLDGNQMALSSLNIALSDEHGRPFDLTRNFLTNSKYSSRRLPKVAYSQMLDDSRFAVLSRETGREFFVTDDSASTMEYLDNHYHNDLSPEEYSERIKGMVQVGKLLSSRPIAVFPSSAVDTESY
ncbi:MAG: hypothetical protein MUF19_02775 [Candidatus Pacebacteria bacterium]|jgi:hypothetical protein|nr:hypothetical protein [Candidatus Paceibacterota bacterium]